MSVVEFNHDFSTQALYVCCNVLCRSNKFWGCRVRVMDITGFFLISILETCVALTGSYGWLPP